MVYINNLNPEVKEYFNILSRGKWPSFIDKYIELPELQRLAGIGLFCGQDYHNVEAIKPKYWYSRLDHSIACALITWTMTCHMSKRQVLAALFHDLGTPAFSHAVDFMLGDAHSQTSSEKNISDIIRNSEQIKAYLEEDKVKVEDVVNVKKYSIIDKDIPALCIDRLEGIFSTGLIWRKFWNLDDISEIYQYVAPTKYWHGFTQPALEPFKGKELAIYDYDPEMFFAGMIKYSISMQTKENKLCMQLLGEILGTASIEQVISREELYKMSQNLEQEIINRIKDSKISYLWEDYTNVSKVRRSSKMSNSPDQFCRMIFPKVRVCNPLVVLCYGPERLSSISGEAMDEEDKLLSHLHNEGSFYVKTKLSKSSVHTLNKNFISR